MNTSDSHLLFQKMLSGLDSWIEKTIIWDQSHPEQIHEAVRSILSAKRVFVTGSGSSRPAACILADTLRQEKDCSATFLTTSQILSTQVSLDDCIILVSQGCNRSDAKLIMHHAQKLGATLLILTAAEVPGVQTIQFFPTSEEEKLFCRPVGVITSYLQALMLATAPQIPQISFSRISPPTTVTEAVAQAETVIVLSSGILCASAENVALALREGSQKQSFFFDIENFGHGQYVPFLAKKETTYFLLFSETTDTMSTKAVERILPLFTKTSATYFHQSLTNTIQSLSGLSVLYYGGRLIEGVNSITGYDMNNPEGKDENRSFHEVPLDYYAS